MNRIKIISLCLLSAGLLHVSNGLGASKRKSDKVLSDPKPSKPKKRVRKKYFTLCHICNGDISRTAPTTKLKDRIIHSDCLKNHPLNCQLCERPSIGFDSDSEDDKSAASTIRYDVRDNNQSMVPTTVKKSSDDDKTVTYQSEIAVPVAPKKDDISVASTILYDLDKKDDISVASTIAYDFAQDDDKTIAYPAAIADQADDMEQAFVNRFVKNLWLLSPSTEEVIRFTSLLRKKDSTCIETLEKRAIKGTIGHAIINSILSQHRASKKPAQPAPQKKNGEDLELEKLLGNSSYDDVSGLDHKHVQPDEAKTIEIKNEEEAKIVNNALIAMEEIDAKILEKNYAQQIEIWNNFQEDFKKKAGDALLDTIAHFIFAFADKFFSENMLHKIAADIGADYAEEFKEVKITKQSLYLRANENMASIATQTINKICKRFFKNNFRTFDATCSKHTSLNLAYKYLIEKSNAIKKTVANVLQEEQKTIEKRKALQEELLQAREEEIALCELQKKQCELQKEQLQQEVENQKQQREIEKLRRQLEGRKTWCQSCTIL